MKKGFNVFLKGVFLTSIATLNGTNASANNVVSLNDCLDFNNPTNGKTTDLIIKTQKKFLLKMNKDNSDYLIAGHRSHSSHRSHASHASHASHYSSYYSGSSSTSTASPTTNPTTNTYNTSSSRSATTTTKKAESTYTTNAYELGDRILKIGMKGYDVTELLNILIAKQYIIPKDGEPTVATGIFEFTELIELAVKKFQKANKLTDDGIVGPTTVYYLKK